MLELIIMGSYKSCPHPHLLTPSQKWSHPPTPSQEKVTPTHTQPKKGHTHTQPHLAQKRTCPPKFSCKCKEKKVFHFPLSNQICQKLKKSSIPIDQ